MPRPLIPNRRETILDAAEALVLSRGFDAMSVAGIADAAGIGKGAVYLEFSSKRDILDALLVRGNERLSAAVRAEVGERPRIGEVYAATARALLDDELMTAAFLDDRGVLGRHVDAADAERFRARHRGVVAWLERLRDDGRLSDAVEPEHLALALSSATIGLLSAARLLGPLDRARLEGAIAALGSMAASFEAP
ncbi:TetR/AcrR family transcriptional regulator [Streptomyces sp. AC495_CC817]|uniref:TetR/AcrR family transcriptional regulator n=1 Tax=Streptomyces sp. AC495_CC817 TaxID=2823900 RepID=UPI001C27AFDE|nr:TetR/AcrR family transcriptional regulator [Streptomyces sp. AC495_CC817]